MISVPFGSMAMNTRVTCSGQDRSTTRRWHCEEVRVEHGELVVEVDHFSNQHVFGVHLSRAPLTELIPNQDQAST